jgi:hypothetical protein
MFENLNRRDFLEKAGKLTLGCATTLSLGSLTGCATLPNEAKQDISQTTWECNPILPIPSVSCYTGTNFQGKQIGFTMQKTESGTFLVTPKRASGDVDPKEAINIFIMNYGIKPTFHAGGHGVYSDANEHFPLQRCRGAISRGVIPVLRYVLLPHEGFRHAAKGRFDDKIKKFAHAAAEFGEPVVLLPWQCVNEPRWPGQVWKWSRGNPDDYKHAWVRMHNIFKEEGAKNVIWSTKMIAGGFGNYYPAIDWAKYTPPTDYVDIIGWNVNEANTGRSFNQQYGSSYKRAANMYPAKPQMLWELGASRYASQAHWMDDALKKIAGPYQRVKSIMFDVMISPGNYDPTHTPKTVEIIKKHFSNGYFLGSALS